MNLRARYGGPTFFEAVAKASFAGTTFLKITISHAMALEFNTSVDESASAV
jgi:hypothetical protein